MRFDRVLIAGSCLAAATFSAGCYRPAEHADAGRASGNSAKPGDPSRPIVHGTDIVDSSTNPSLKMRTSEELIAQARKRAEEDARNGATAVGTSIAGPVPSGTALVAGSTPTGSTATGPTATGSTAPASTTTASPSSSAVASAADSAAPDPYSRPAIKPLVAAAPPAEVRDRSPVRKTPGIPPPRTRVLAAPETSGGVLGITFDSLMFDIKPDEVFKSTMFSDAVRGLFERKVKIRGYIWPDVPYQTGNTQFILVRDDKGCCFGPGALIYDNVVVKMAPGKSVDFTVRPIAVEGVLRFKEVRFLNKPPSSIYELEADAVE